MVQKQKSKPKAPSTKELDSVFLLKIVLYMVLGAQWLWLVPATGTSSLPIPVGLLAGIVFALHDHFQIDRKIEYAVLLIAALIGFMANIGISVAV